MLTTIKLTSSVFRSVLVVEYENKQKQSPKYDRYNEEHLWKHIKWRRSGYVQSN